VRRNTYTVTYIANGGIGTVPVDTVHYEAGTPATIQHKGNLEKSNYTFTEWNSSSDGQGTPYAVGNTVTMNSNLILYAQWKQNNTYRLTYAGGDGTSGTAPVDLIEYTQGAEAVVKPAGSLTKSGYLLEGWRTTSDETLYKPGDKISMTGDITLYAQWKAISNDTETKTFNAINVETDQWYSITAVKLATGEHCIVYADTGSGVSEEKAQAIVEEYDQNIHDKITGAFGDFTDVDRNGKVTFLLLDIQDGYKSGDVSYAAGFFQWVHMMAANSYYPHSNETDMLFLDTYPQEVGSEGFYNTIAHELQHLINFSITGGQQDTWIDEGLATAAEYLYQGKHTGHVNMFNNDYEKLIRYGDNFFVWGNYLADYATAYMFFQWLRIHADNGEAIYKEIVNSTDKDYRAVVALANARIAPPPDGASSWDWEVLLRTWMLANARNDASGLYGYKGELAPKVWYVALTNKTRYFAPGEGIFTQMSGTSFSPGNSGTHIKYVGFGNDTLDTSGATYEGQYLLTFNANTTNKGSSETGYLANTATATAGDRSMSLSLDGDTLNSDTLNSDTLNSDTPDTERPAKPYGIGVQFKPDGTILRRE
jgi:uncharacterized repeat protein (TIGR02543 family)